MADVKINDLAAISAPASTDVLPIVDVSLDTTNKISVSSILKTVPDGTASAPGIAFEGDSNTGIYHPASEEISFTTSGTQRLTIRSDGKVGIGTSNPTQVLEVAGTVKATNFEGGSSGMTINSDDVTEGSTNLFSQWDNVTGGINYASGNVGVGTTSPAYKLDLKDADAEEVVAKLAEGADANYELVAANGSGTDADGNEVARFGVQYKGTGWNSFLSYIRGNGAQAGSISVSTSNTQQVTIDDNGNIGVGTNTPSQKVEIKSSNPRLKITDSDTTAATSTSYIEFSGSDARSAVIFTDSEGFNFQTDSEGANEFRFITGGADERIRIKTDGKVGIGTDSPVGTAHLKAATPVATFQPTADTQEGQINFIDTAGTFKGRVGYAYDTDSLEFYTDGSQRVTVDSSGRLLVGTNEAIGSTAKLAEIVGGNFALNRFANDAFGSALVYEKGRGSTVGTIVQNGDTLGSVIFRGDDGTDTFSTAASIECAVDGVPGSNDMPGRLVFSTASDGSASATERVRIDSAGNVGCGTSDPRCRLSASIADTTAYSTSLSTSGGNPDGSEIVYFQNTDNSSTNNKYALQSFQIAAGAGQSNVFGRFGLIRTAASEQAFVWQLRNLGGAGATATQEAMRINSDGKVGIGTSSPSQKLTIRSTASDQLRIEDNAGDGFNVVRDTTTGFLDFDGTQETFSGFSFSTTPTGGTLTERLTILNSGNVGIGESAPVGKLNLVYSGTIPSLTYDTADEINLDAGGVQVAFGIDSGSPFGGFIQARDNTNAARTLNLNPVGGNVGIGTRSPSDFGAGFTTVEAKNSSGGVFRSNANDAVFTDVYSDASVGGVIRTATNNSLNFYTNNLLAATIDTSQRFLLGTTTAINNGGLIPVLQIADNSANAAFSFTRYTTNSNGPAVVLAKSRGGSVGTIEAVTSGTELGKFIFAGADVTTSGDLATKGAEIRCTVQGTVAANSVPARLSFYTRDESNTDNNPVENFRINNDGELQANDTTIGAFSDQRLKENIVDFTYDIENFKQYQPKTFDWKNPELHGGKAGNRGFIAQEVEAIDPYWVSESDVDAETADAELLEPDLMAKVSKLGKKDAMYISVIQQLIGKIETLEQRLSDAGL